MTPPFAISNQGIKQLGGGVGSITPRILKHKKAVVRYRAWRNR